MIFRIIHEPCTASRSTWACELKWRIQRAAPLQCSHAPRERVSWNGLVLDKRQVSLVTLHVSVWVEMQWASRQPLRVVSHAPRERVSWNILFRFMEWGWNSHAPRERVSWNLSKSEKKQAVIVTLHVSVWVEIFPSQRKNKLLLSRSTWACELKLYITKSTTSFNWSRSTWACELKCIWGHSQELWNASRSTWACELKWNSCHKYSAVERHAPRERVSWNIRINSHVLLFLVSHAHVERDL